MYIVQIVQEVVFHMRSKEDKALGQTASVVSGGEWSRSISCTIKVVSIRQQNKQRMDGLPKFTRWVFLLLHWTSLNRWCWRHLYRVAGGDSKSWSQGRSPQFHSWNDVNLTQAATHRRVRPPISKERPNSFELLKGVICGFGEKLGSYKQP